MISDSLKMKSSEIRFDIFFKIRSTLFSIWILYDIINIIYIAYFWNDMWIFFEKKKNYYYEYL